LVTNHLNIILLLSTLLWASAGAEVQYAVSGLRNGETENVLAYLKAGRHQLEDDPSAMRLGRFTARVEASAAKALQPFGYYQPQIHASVERKDTDWRVQLDIDPGQPVRWRNIEVRLQGDGESDDDLAGIASSQIMQVGARAIHTEYETTKSRLRREAAERGYLDAIFSRKELVIDPVAGTADAFITLDTGIRYRFGPLIIEQDVIHDELLQRYVNINQGDYYSSTRLLVAKQALYSTDFFSSVELYPEPENAVGSEVPIRLRAQKGKKHRFGVGLGYGTDTGYRVSGAWVMRRVNKSGHNLAFDARVSPIKWTFNSAYSIPIGNPALERITLNAGTVDEELADLNSRRVYGSYQILKVPGPWQRQTSLAMIDETSDLPSRQQYDRYWVPSFRVMRTWSDRVLEAERGFQLLGDIEGSSRTLGLETGYLQARIRGRLLLPLWSDASLFLRGEAGSTWTDNFDALPASRRFFAGGDDSIRGYGYNSLSPIDSLGFASGGKHLLAGSIEFTHKIRGPWGVAVFTDSGNAFNTASDPFKVSAGVGLRWQSPVGMVRIDVAKSLSDTDRSPRLHLSVGPEF